jgi:hypothetical protein
VLTTGFTSAKTTGDCWSAHPAVAASPRPAVRRLITII